MPTMRKNLITGTKVKILKCGHYDVKNNTIGVFTQHMEGGIAVKVSGLFRKANELQYEPSTETVFVAEGDYEVLA